LSHYVWDCSGLRRQRGSARPRARRPSAGLIGGSGPRGGALLLDVDHWLLHAAFLHQSSPAVVWVVWDGGRGDKHRLRLTATARSATLGPGTRGGPGLGNSDRDFGVKEPNSLNHGIRFSKMSVKIAREIFPGSASAAIPAAEVADELDLS